MTEVGGGKAARSESHHFTKNTQGTLRPVIVMFFTDGSSIDGRIRTSATRIIGSDYLQIVDEQVYKRFSANGNPNLHHFQPSIL